MPPATDPADLPFDIKLMTATTQVLWVLLAVWCAGVLLLWGLQHPVWTVRAITVQGDVAHQSAAGLQAHLADQWGDQPGQRVSASFFTADVQQVRQLFESAPWVEHALVQRVFPNRLRVTLQEHEAVAWWGDPDAGQLLSRKGVVFEASGNELEGLPELAGPVDQSALIWDNFRQLRTLLERYGLGLSRLELTEHGSWRGVLEGGAEVEFGRGSPEELLARTEAFATTRPVLTQRYAGRLQSVDLRYPQGYALRVQGVTTLAEDSAQPSTRHPAAAAPAPTDNRHAAKPTPKTRSTQAN